MTFPIPFFIRTFRDFDITTLGEWDSSTNLTHTFNWGFPADEYCHLVVAHFASSSGPNILPQTGYTADGSAMANIDLNFVGENVGSTLTTGARSTVGDDGRAIWYTHINVDGKSSIEVEQPSLYAGSVAYGYLLTGMTNAGSGAHGLTDAIIDSNSCGNDDGGNVALRDPDLIVNTTSTSFALCGAGDNLSFITGVSDIDDYLQGSYFGFDMDHSGGSLNYEIPATGTSGARIGSVIVFERPQ